MNITVAETAGFCYGVKRAVEIAEASAKDGSVTLGAVIHNKNVISRLGELGIYSVDSISDIPEGRSVVIRSHGVGEDIYRELEQKSISYIDATCPYVTKIQKIVDEHYKAGYSIVIIGDKDHPEVISIAGWCKDSRIFRDDGELMAFMNSPSFEPDKPLCVVCQTTSVKEVFNNCAELIKNRCTNCKIFDTICNATIKRQAEARWLSEKCDAMVVIGDRGSANTRKLFDICKEVCSAVFFVENAGDLDLSVFTGHAAVGITAGASTPDWIIKEVVLAMSEEFNNMEENFAELLEKSFKTLNTGDKVTGVITAITPTELHVDLGTKHAGYIPVSEISDDPNVKAEDLFKVGDEVETYAMRVNDVEGTVMLSKKRLDTVKGWEELEEARESRAIMEGIVVEENKGGIVVSVKGVRVFVPASQTGVPKDTPMSSIIKNRVKLRITEFNRARRRVVGSIGAVLADERRVASEKIWTDIEVGNKYSGVVKSLTSYGAFVDIGGVDGMVHVSELTWKRIKNPSEFVKPGDKLDVTVIALNRDKKQISLTAKNLAENPWAEFTGKQAEGDIVTVKVLKFMPFGAFAEIIPGVDGLIHISQIADRRIDKPGDVLKEGQEVAAKIVGIDNEKKKVSLSIRATLEPNAEDVKKAQEADEIVAVSDGTADTAPAAAEETAEGTETGAEE